MFCPNCGTKNEEAAQRCRQCGLELAEKKAAPKFKGTMMMGNSPFAGQQPGGAPAPGAGAPGAVPGTPAPGAPAATPSAAPQASRAALKGTMVGVAPPSLGAAAPPAAPAQSAAPQAGAPAAGAPAAGAKPMLKGTMIGVAPQGFGVPAGGAAAGGAAPAAPAGGSAPPAGTPSAPPAAEAAKVAPKLKGTMIGVAPQGFNPADLAAKAAAAAPSAAPAAPAGVDLGKTEPPPPMDGSYGATEAFAAVPAAPQAPAQDEVNPLGGTMLGMAAPDFGAPPAAAPAADAAAYGLGATQPNPAYVPPERQQPAYEEPSTGVPSAAARLGSPGASEAITTTPGVHGPIGKDRNPVVTFLLSMLCFVYALIAIVQMLGELRAFRQKNDISILLFFIPIINIIEVWKLPAKVADAQRMAGIQNPQVAHPVLYLFFGIYFLPADLNETWSAARRNIG